MKTATTCIAFAVILSCFFSAQATSQPRQPDIHSADRIATGSEGLPLVAWTSLVAWPIASPQPVLASDGNVHLVYELLVMNVSSSVMTLDRLETLDASKGDAVVNTKSGDESSGPSKALTSKRRSRRFLPEARGPWGHSS